MKRVIFTVAALMAGAVAFAQTPTVVAPIVQQTNPNAGASSGSNYSNIAQAGVGSDATVQQQGTANASFISQTGTSATSRNSVDVLQWGNVQPSISGQENYSDITQNGDGNDFRVRQQGDFNAVLGSSTGSLNTALVQQGADGAQQAENNEAIVTQSGRENDAEVQQRFDNSQAVITQTNNALTGVGNQSYQEQIANPNASAGHTAIGSQNGDGNTLIQLQEGPGSGNYAEALQGDGTTQATGAFAQQVQLGEGNEAYVTQYLSSDTSYQEQIGEDNIAVVDQNTGGVASGGNNLAEQYQDGSDNDARSDQNGNNNDSFQEQYGTNNTSTVMQRNGQVAGNKAVNIQNGDQNKSMINQRANNNMAFVDQLGFGHTSVVNQNNPLGGSPAATSGSNTATVTQRNANVALSPSQTQRAAATAKHSF